MITDTKQCHHETLAKSSVAHIQRCRECGCVSIHVGPVTLRLDERALEIMWQTIGSAVATMHSRANDSHSVSHALSRSCA